MITKLTGFNKTPKTACNVATAPANKLVPAAAILLVILTAVLEADNVLFPVDAPTLAVALCFFAVASCFSAFVTCLLEVETCLLALTSCLVEFAFCLLAFALCFFIFAFSFSAFVKFLVVSQSISVAAFASLVALANFSCAC